MDFSKAINQELGIEEKESASKTVVNRQVFKKAMVLEKVVAADSVPFDIAKYVPNKYLQEALKRFPGSILNVSPINGAIEFIFGKQIS